MIGFLGGCILGFMIGGLIGGLIGSCIDIKAYYDYKYKVKELELREMKNIQEYLKKAGGNNE